MNWILTSERLPEKGQWCAVILYGQIGEGKPTFKSRFTGRGWAGVGASIDEVYAWQPL